MRRIGLISDSHGKLDDRVSLAFEGVDEIIHAGDICDPHVLWVLERIAPVTAVLGNCDDRSAFGFDDLADIAEKPVEGRRVLVVHNRRDMGPVPAGIDVVVFGHSHMPLVEETDGVLWVNPGSAQQPRRSPIGRSVALLTVEACGAKARIIALDELSEAL